jgi:hypothetical protein
MTAPHRTRHTSRRLHEQGRVPAADLPRWFALQEQGTKLEERLPATGTLTMDLRLRLSPGDNRREFHLARDRRVYAAVSQAWSYHRWPRGARPLEVVIVRRGRPRLDPANLGSACKAVIDQVAAELGFNDREFVLDDGEEGVRLRLRQEVVEVHAVRIEVRWT